MAAKIALSLTPGSGRRALPINGALYSSGELGTWLLKLAEIPTIIPQKDGEFIKSHVSVEIYRVPVLEGLVFACALPKNQSFQNGHPILLDSKEDESKTASSHPCYTPIHHSSGHLLQILPN